MSRTITALLALFLTLAGCATPSPQALSTVQIEATPGKGVIYIVRPRPDFTYHPAPIRLDGQPLAVMYSGTYVRVEVPPGRHQITGDVGVDAGDITIDAKPGEVYFIRHSVAGSYRSFDSVSSFYTRLNEQQARSLMLHAERVRS